MTGGPRIDGYAWAGGHEAMLRFGPDEGPLVVAALPLFEEANRTRAFVVAILRALAERGVGGVLPDVPGQGESLALLEALALSDMQTAFAAATAELGCGGRPIYAITVRSGALLPIIVRGDAGATVGDGRRLDGIWQLAPQDGPSLLRELSRVKHAGSGSGQPDDRTSPTAFAGNLVSTAMLAELATAIPVGPARTVRLSTDPAPADRTVEGPPLWRRSEPGVDAVLSQILADDIADWIATCEG